VGEVIYIITLHMLGIEITEKERNIDATRSPGKGAGNEEWTETKSSRTSPWFSCDKEETGRSGRVDAR